METLPVQTELIQTEDATSEHSQIPTAHNEGAIHLMQRGILVIHVDRRGI